MTASKPEEVYATTELNFRSFFCFRCVLLVFISFSKGCHSCTACCTGIEDNTSLNPNIILTVAF